MKVAVGWLGWSEKKALSANINTIHLGYEGRIDLLKTIFGGGEPKDKDQKSTLVEVTADMDVATTVPKDARGNPITLTASLFDSFEFAQDKRHRAPPRTKGPQDRSPSRRKGKREK